MNVDETTLVLGIETSCDETAAAVVADGRRALSDVVSTQIEIHRRWGGVVPELASRNHVVQIMPVVDEAVTRAGGPGAVDAIAVTSGPGLVGALLSGGPGGPGVRLGTAAAHVTILDNPSTAGAPARPPGCEEVTCRSRPTRRPASRRGRRC